MKNDFRQSIANIDATTWGKKYTDFECEVGDSKQSVFFPQLKIMYALNQCNFSMRLLGSVTRQPEATPEKVTCGIDAIDAEFYDGGVGIGVKLTVTSKLNEIRFSLNSKNVRFVRQAKFTDAFGNIATNIAEGSIYYADGLRTVANMGAIHRPENVHGSVAVFHVFGALTINGIYKSKKVFHLFRPRLTAQDGSTRLIDFAVNPSMLTLDLSDVSAPLPWVIA